MPQGARVSNVVPIRPCDYCKERKLDVKHRGLNQWTCDDCETDYQGEYTVDPDEPEGA